MKGNALKRILAACLALFLVSGNVPIKPVSDVLNSIAITTYADEPVEVSTWGALVDALKTNGSIKLMQNITPVLGDDKLVVPTNTTVILDLNGKTIDAVSQSSYVIQNHGTLTINDSDTGGRITGGGIGIHNSNGTLTLNGITITGNKAKKGAGIHNYCGTVTITNCTISGNTATNDSLGGGIYNESGSVTIENSFVSGNSASKGAVYITAAQALCR